MDRPKGHGDFADLIRAQWNGVELRQIEGELEDLERHPGYARLLAILEARERLLVDRVVDGPVDSVRATDQVLGMVSGLRQFSHAADSIKYEANQARERAQAAAAEADAEGATT